MRTLLRSRHAGPTAKHRDGLSQPPNGIVVGKVVGITANGLPLVEFAGTSTEGVPARSLIRVDPSSIGREVALAFEQGRRTSPIVIGMLSLPAQRPDDPGARSSSASDLGATSDSVDVDLDGKRVTLSAATEIVLRCGSASLTLTRAGKIIIRGTYVLSRSTGVQRIQGGSVQIN